MTRWCCLHLRQDRSHSCDCPLSTCIRPSPGRIHTNPIEVTNSALHLKRKNTHSLDIMRTIALFLAVAMVTTAPMGHHHAPSLVLAQHPCSAFCANMFAFHSSPSPSSSYKNEGKDCSGYCVRRFGRSRRPMPNPNMDGPVPSTTPMYLPRESYSTGTSPPKKMYRRSQSFPTLHYTQQPGYMDESTLQERMSNDQMLTGIGWMPNGSMPPATPLS